MPTISLRVDQNNRWTRNVKKTKTEKNKVGKGYNERVRAKWLSCAFKLGFFKSICKTSLIFKSNLELASPIILKWRELYKPKHVAVECRCFRIWDLLSFLISSSILVLKWQQIMRI